jgi:hypothetical protein
MSYLNSDLELCCKCHSVNDSIDLFWIDGEIETENQIKVSEKMILKNYDCICEPCFYHLLKGN